jgi:hypothetical protein
MFVAHDIMLTPDEYIQSMFLTDFDTSISGLVNLVNETTPEK